ncbi:hypothetical protein [Amycolatopsis alkalitolerans]|uniref:MFS transporter n=1 Tax=Amycolatopsis alkalitolerans TaxID=2547244 RepID=A0A5C4M778_9PSEU|nr:hypothetical protein [Amycolatopsis alkalitolerans]TNC29216.1 hypothetical protein FG385_03835 [Amycolatopsis alkalitolerans]
MFVGASNAPLAVLCIELFAARVRFATGAIGQALDAGLIGGSRPLVATALIAATGLALAPAYYLVVFVVLALIIMAALVPETRGADLASGEVALGASKITRNTVA